MSNEMRVWEYDKIEDEKLIVKKYPFLHIRDIDGTIDTHSKFPMMSLEIPDGWYELFFQMCDDLKEVLIEEAKHEIDEDNMMMALHILNAIYNSDCPDGSYYLYDRSMGTLETPTPITCKEDLEDYIDFEEDEEDDRSELPWDYGKHFD